ncbi:MAG: coproporphyrinogen III oxidase, partial [Campylobacteraceae bacterium]|nr:coproporphyrinogen III oxidase [Campylobacteraceae bacterium]
RYDKFGSGQEIFEKIAKIITILPIISIDIIFNFPNQTQKALMYDLEMLKKLYPEQTSVYPLMSSDIMRDNIKSKLGNFSVENERRYFDIVKESLREAYPVKYGWSFMKKHSDLIDEYVIDKSEYIGAGAGAFSFLDGSLYVNEFSLENYMRSIAKRGISTAYKKSFSQKSISYYEILTKLYSGAVAKDAFKGLFWQFTALKLIGAVREEESAISVTDFGDYLFMNAMKEFYIGMDKIRLMGKSAL